jgi:ACS family hexuronate transporter-like MFS transporter
VSFESAGKYRWVVCALLFFATTVNYVDRQILSLIKEFLDAELGWSNETFGWVNGAFQLSYAVGLFIFGWFVDRYGTKIGYATSIVLWSIAAMSHALVGSVNGFFAARVFLGVSEGGNFPSRSRCGSRSASVPSPTPSSTRARTWGRSSPPP